MNHKSLNNLCIIFQLCFTAKILLVDAYVFTGLQFFSCWLHIFVLRFNNWFFLQSATQRTPCICVVVLSKLIWHFLFWNEFAKQSIWLLCLATSATDPNPHWSQRLCSVEIPKNCVSCLKLWMSAICVTTLPVYRKSRICARVRSGEEICITILLCVVSADSSTFQQRSLSHWNCLVWSIPWDFSKHEHEKLHEAELIMFSAKVIQLAVTCLKYGEAAFRTSECAFSVLPSSDTRTTSQAVPLKKEHQTFSIENSKTLSESGGQSARAGDAQTNKALYHRLCRCWWFGAATRASCFLAAQFSVDHLRPLPSTTQQLLPSQLSTFRYSCQQSHWIPFCHKTYHLFMGDNRFKRRWSANLHQCPHL